MLLNLLRHFSKFHSRSSEIFILKSLILRFWWKPYLHVSSYPKTIQIATSTTRLWNKDSQTSIYMDCALISLLDIGAELTDSLK